MNKNGEPIAGNQQQREPTVENPTPDDNVPNYNDMEVSSVAYHLWQTAGRPAGRYMEFWAEAEQRLLAKRKAQIAKRPSRTAASAPAQEHSLKFDAKKESGNNQPPPCSEAVT
jgi:hypothetical protein